jgi:hypothetical protein
VIVVAGEVTLEGTVDDRRQKRMAEEAIENMNGVKDVHNRLKSKGGFIASLFGSSDDDSKKDDRARNASAGSSSGISGASGSSGSTTSGTSGSTGSTSSSETDKSKK